MQIKKRFLRSETSLIQTIGRVARNSEGHVIMYADTITDSMRKALDETERRRSIQMKYNEEHGITPQSIHKAVRDLITISRKAASAEMQIEKDPESMSKAELGEAGRGSDQADEESSSRIELRGSGRAA